MQNECVSCRRPKATLQCEACHEALCKSCDRFLDAETFSFLPEIPEELKHTHYCPSCYEAHVEPAIESYNETMERARDVYIFFTSQRADIPILKKALQPVSVSSCPDRDETILRLAFLAVQQGFNAVIETDVTSEKVRNAGYQKTLWKGKGVPAELDVERFESRSRRH